MKTYVKVFIGIMVVILMVCSGIQLVNNSRLNYYTKVCENTAAYTGMQFVGIYSGNGDSDDLHSWMDAACCANGGIVEWDVIKEDGDLWIIRCTVNPRTRNEKHYLMAWI